jgi:hypothetical protein
LSKIDLQSAIDAEYRIDQLFLECDFSANHPVMLDWVAIKFALKNARQITKNTGLQPTNTCDHIFRSDGNQVKCTVCNAIYDLKC